MTLTEEQGGFDLEKARASIAHYRIENPSNVDTESALKELVDQANLAEDALAEIERLRADLEQSVRVVEARVEVIDQQAARIKDLEADLEQSEICIRARLEVIEQLQTENEELQESLTEAYLLGSHKKAKELAPRIAELEDALVEERAGAIRCESYDHCEGMYIIDLPDAMIRARQELQAEGKIGPDARPLCWQITEERVNALESAEWVLEHISACYPDCEGLITKPNPEAVGLIRAMLKGAEQ